jgi:hypothetical protein
MVSSFRLGLQWKLHIQVTITFNDNGTFISSDWDSGKWMQVNGMILWQYDGLKTAYGGYIVENAMIGSMSSPSLEKMVAGMR